MNRVCLCKSKIFRMSTRYILIRLQEVNFVFGSFSLTDSSAFVATQRDDSVQWTHCHVVGRDSGEIMFRPDDIATNEVRSE